MLRDAERAEVEDEVRDLGLQRQGDLDEGAMWPTAFAVTSLTAAEEARIEALVKKAVS